MTIVVKQPQAEERLLAAGEALMREHFGDPAMSLGAGFQFVSPTLVAERAGMSKGMLYHVFGRDGGRAFDNYIAGLAERVIVEYSMPGELELVATELHDLGTPWQQALVLLCDHELDSLVRRQDRRLAFVQSLSLCAYAGCPPVLRSLRHGAQVTYETLARFYELALGLYGIGLRRQPGTGRQLDFVDLARALSCVTEGFALEGLHSPEVMEADLAWTIGQRLQPCSLFAITVLAVVRELTELVEGPRASAGIGRTA